MEPFITTFTGRKVNPLNLRVEDVCIEDIAHHLATLNRFVGALKRPVSIAQHSVYVSRLLARTGWESEGLFHDSSECYLGDVSRWVKRMPEMKAYREAEDRAWIVICRALCIRPDGNPDVNLIVKEADDLMVRYEYLQMGHKNQHMFELATHPKPTRREIDRVGEWIPWTWRQSERRFLDHARMLGFKI